MLRPTFTEALQGVTTLDHAAEVIVKNMVDLRDHTPAIVELTNQVLRHLKIPVELRPSTIPNAGMGVFATADIYLAETREDADAGADRVCTYGGIRMSHNVYSANGMPGGEYAVETGRGEEVLDGRTCFALWQVGRWCNGSPREGWVVPAGVPAPNCVIARAHGGDDVFISPIRNIRTDEEIIVDYGQQYKWEEYGFARVPEAAVVPAVPLPTVKSKRRGGAAPTKRTRTGTIEACLQCGFIGKMFLCSGCDRASYCGDACAQTHWDERHHKDCGGLRTNKGH